MDNNVVNTTLGQAEGVAMDGFVKWFGIPYAKPPVGELRFKRAVEHGGWEGIRKCEKMGPKPIQMAGGKFADLTKTETPESEDCLTLNIWAPEGAVAGIAEKDVSGDFEKNTAGNIDKATAGNPVQREQLPVFVWIYGGGHHAGDAAAAEYMLDEFAKEDVVAVSFNYRLGVLGFYDFSEYDDSFDSNCAISDMILALKWVNENIASFGGDPSRVTLCGESAGGSAILALLSSESARQYFSQAIVMSGIASNTSRKKMQRINNERFLRRVGVGTDEVARLRDMDVSILKEGCAQFFAEREVDNPGIMANGPVVDDLVSALPLEAISQGAAAGKRVMFGTCRNEGGLFTRMKICPETWQDVDKMLTVNGYEEKIPEFHYRYTRKTEKRSVMAINRDRMFLADTVKCALAQSKYNDTFMYRFDFNTPFSRILKLGPTHSMDVCPALGTKDGNMFLLYKGVRSRKIDRLFETMHGAFVRFVKTGDPSGGSIGSWPAFDDKTGEVMIFDEECRIDDLKEVFDETYANLWADISLYAGD